MIINWMIFWMCHLLSPFSQKIKTPWQEELLVFALDKIALLALQFIAPPPLCTRARNTKRSLLACLCFTCCCKSWADCSSSSSNAGLLYWLSLDVVDAASVSLIPLWVYYYLTHFHQLTLPGLQVIKKKLYLYIYIYIHTHTHTHS